MMNIWRNNSEEQRSRENLVLYHHLPSPFSQSQGLPGGSAGGVWGGGGAGSPGGRAFGVPPPLPALPDARSRTPVALASAVFFPSAISAPPSGLQEERGVSEVGGLGWKSWPEAGGGEIFVGETPEATSDGGISFLVSISGEQCPRPHPPAPQGL